MIVRQPPKLTNRDSLIQYVTIQLWSWLKQLSNNLLKISFQDNFQSFTVRDLELKAGIEVAIPNQFAKEYQGVIPSERIITRQIGNSYIVDGTTKWNEGHVYLISPLADATITVTFFK